MSIADPPEVAPVADTTSLQRLDRLIERLLDSGESAAAAGEWDRATETALDVLAVDPTNARAQRIVDSAREQQPLAGQRALITLLFSDLVGSTPLADAVEPETMRDLYRAYREVAHSAVERYGGQVIQFQGDGIVACFGHPEAHEDDARRAVLAGLALCRATPAVARQQHLDVQVRVGVHTGMAVVANFGPASVGERGTIIGTPPNVAARLQSVAAPGRLVVSDVTHHIIEADFETTSLGLQELKGIARPIEVFTVGVSRHPTSRLEAARFHRTALVGRDDVRARLVAAWASVTEQPDVGTPGFLVRGDAGVGKSRLVADLRRRVEEAGGGILETGCSAYHSRVVFWPAARMIERELELTQDDDKAARLDALRESLSLRNLDDSVLALLAPLLGIGPVDELPLPEISAPALRHQQIELMLEWLRRLAAAQPRLLLVEDLQWSDPSTAELLGRIASDPPPGALIVLTSRSEPAEEWRHALVDLPLGRLTDEDARLLVDGLSDGTLTTEQRDTIVGRGEGMPLFLEELTVAALTAAGGALPIRLNELFTSRLKAPGVDLRLAQMAATIGATFEVDLLSLVAGEGSDVEGGLRRMQKVGLIEPALDEDESVLRFRHMLLRDAAYETQVLDTRRDNHARVAAAMASRPSATEAPPAVIAHHLDRSGAHREAIAQYFVAADQANKSGANAEALELVGRALELCLALPAGLDRDVTELGLRLLRVLCASSLKGYGAEEVGEDTLAVEELCRSIPPSALTVTALIVVWSFAFTKGELPRAAALAEVITATGRRARAGRAPAGRGLGGRVPGLLRGAPGRGPQAVRGGDRGAGRPAADVAAAQRPARRLDDRPRLRVRPRGRPRAGGALGADGHRTGRGATVPPRRLEPGLRAGVRGVDAHGDRRSGGRAPSGPGDGRGGTGPRLPVLHRARRGLHGSVDPGCARRSRPGERASRAAAGHGAPLDVGDHGGEPGAAPTATAAASRRPWRGSTPRRSASSNPVSTSAFPGSCWPRPRSRRSTRP